jgi:hypothetical protein
MHKKGCPLPHMTSTGKSKSKKARKRDLRAAVAGTECYDWSTFGLRQGLAGPTTRTLAIWLAQRILCLEDVILHECTPKFMMAILHRHLGSFFDIHSLPLKDGCISPHQLGWPCHRPRLYTVLTRKGAVRLPRG